jgi:hypothetical protein
LRGKAKLRRYWEQALALSPALHFELIEIFASPDGVAVLYRNERGTKVCEYLRVNDVGLIAQGSASHSV